MAVGNLLTNLLEAVILVVRLAELTLEASVDLGTDTDAISNLDGGHLTSHLDCFTNDLVPNTDR